MVEVCKVSPEMKEQKNFLFIISGVTCSKQLADQGPNLLSVSLYSSVLSLANIQGFQCT
jgi:hypothetical protein